MPTLLTTPKMHPALAARVEASVTGKRGGVLAVSRTKPRLVMLARVGAIVIVAFIVQSVIGVRKKERDEVKRLRSELLERVRAPSLAVTGDDRGSLERIGALLVKLSRSFDAEVIAPELRTKAGLDAVLARPLLYVRGPLGSFASAPQIADSAATSAKDALVLCLLDPPPSRAEKDVLPKVRVAYGTGAALEAQTAHVRRLGEAQAGLPFLTPDYVARVEASSDIAELTKMKKELARAPLDAAARAAKASFLLVAMDEPGEGGTPAELDGERRHHVRVAIVDLATQRTILDTRKLADPSWISAERRADMARGMDSCALALDVRDAALAAR